MLRLLGAKTTRASSQNEMIVFIEFKWYSRASIVCAFVFYIYIWNLKINLISRNNFLDYHSPISSLFRARRQICLFRREHFWWSWSQANFQNLYLLVVKEKKTQIKSSFKNSVTKMVIHLFKSLKFWTNSDSPHRS